MSNSLLEISSIRPKEASSVKWRSKEAWAVLSFFLLFLLFLYFGSAASLRILYPILSLVVAVYLYIRHQVLYIGFCWWIWFLSPLFIRLVDFRIGWDPSRQMLIAPYLVVFVTTLTLVKYLPRAYRENGLPFVLAFSGVAYGLFIGFINNSPVAVTRSLLDWLSPLLLAFHLFVNWRDYPIYRQHIKRVFLWFVLLLGTYGIYQFVAAPEWDRYWLIQSGMFTSMGSPEPFGMRVWSTMHSTGPFGAVMQSGLLLLLTSSSALIFPASLVGYLSLLLAQTRGAWGALLLGIFILMGSVKEKLQMRFFSIVLVIVVCVIPILAIDPISDVVVTRLETFTNLSTDQSFNDRASNYDRQLGIAFSSLLGTGLGNTWVVNERTGQIEVIVIDSGILDIFFTLGWMGAALYVGGLASALLRIANLEECKFDSFVAASRAIVISLFSMLIIGSTMIGVGGMMLWGFMAMSLSAQKFYKIKNQKHISSRKF